VRAARLSPPVSAAEVFTGEGTGTNSVAIWTHVAATNAPGVLLASGSWAMSSTNSWQGAALSTPVPLSAGTTYWFVWGCVNGSQASIDLPSTTAITQPYRGSTNAGASWTGPFQSATRPWKFRVTCGTPGWQTNQSCSSMIVGGVVSGGTGAAVTLAAVGAPTTVDFGGSAD